MDLQNLARSAFDHRHVRHDVLFGHTLVTLKGRDLGRTAPQPVEHGLHTSTHRRQGLQRRRIFQLVRLSRLVRLVEAVLQVLEQPLLVRGALPWLRVFQGLVLSPQLLDARLDLLDVPTLGVGKVEVGKILIFRIDEGLYQLVDGADARGGLDLCESLLIAGHLLHGAVDGRLVLRHPPGRGCDLLLELGLLRQGQVTLLIVVGDSGPLPLTHELLHLLVVLDEPAQLLPLPFEFLVLLVGLLLEGSHLLLRLVPSLVRRVGLLDDVRHLLLLLLQLVLQLLVDVVEHHPLPPEPVDRIPLHLVIGHGVVELLERLV
mmetsp:Transcript_11744/g.27959  ORF Transcript_11744/g.27959 Transcript_11744/m.27959 type:complete len:317 (-) Transcript_11744:426-1376(-)